VTSIVHNVKADYCRVHRMLKMKCSVENQTLTTGSRILETQKK
jgi:hypothetical protein